MNVWSKGDDAAVCLSYFYHGEKAKPELAVRSKWGKPYPIGWLDPNNPGAQDYILAELREYGWSAEAVPFVMRWSFGVTEKGEAAPLWRRLILR